MDAIYARQSVDRSDSISIESQIQFCQYETRGGAYRTYIDRGYSGKNTERPAFRAMMEDMKAGEIRRIIVYKLDRISRSILDFSNMMETLGKYRVEFVSATEKFDTASPMGRAMLNICIVFAQLERETIQKRVADAYFARSQKSFYMGGRLPYGYRLVPTVIDGVKTAMYEIVPEEAEVVRLAYELYAQPECSYGDVIRAFQANGITKKGKPWERTRLADLLRNPIYVRADLGVYQFYRSQGAIIEGDPSHFIGVNGCYYYKGRESVGRKQVNLEGNHLVLAPHEGIVPAEIWLRCRLKCLRARQARPYQKAKNTWLAGKVKCGVCGYALVDKGYATSKARHLLCSHRMETKACPGPGTIYTAEVEEIVYEEIRKKLAQWAVLRCKQGPAADPELTGLRVRLTQVESEIAGLADRLSAADDVMYRYISAKLGELDARERELRQQIEARSHPKEVALREVTGHPDLWEELTFEDKRRVVDQLIKVIHATADAIEIQWRI